MFHSHLNYSVLSLFLLTGGFPIMWESGLSYLLLIKVLDWYLHIQCSFWFIPISPGRQLQEVPEQGILTSQPLRAFFLTRVEDIWIYVWALAPARFPQGLASS